MSIKGIKPQGKPWTHLVLTSLALLRPRGAGYYTLCFARARCECEDTFTRSSLGGKSLVQGSTLHKPCTTCTKIKRVVEMSKVRPCSWGWSRIRRRVVVLAGMRKLTDGEKFSNMSVIESAPRSLMHYLIFRASGTRANEDEQRPCSSVRLFSRTIYSSTRVKNFS